MAYIVSIKFKTQFCQGIESATSPARAGPLYSSLDVKYFRRTVFPRELGPGGPYSLRVYTVPRAKHCPRATVYTMTPYIIMYNNNSILFLRYEINIKYIYSYSRINQWTYTSTLLHKHTASLHTCNVHMHKILTLQHYSV